jgi:cytochrome c551/c552
MPLDPGANLPLLRFLLAVLLCILLPLAGLTAAGATVSLVVALAGLRDRSAEAVRRAAVIVRGAVLPASAGAAVLLLTGLILFLAGIVYPVGAATPLGLGTLALLATGLGLINFFRRAVDRRTAVAVVAGGVGILLTIASLFLLASGEGMLVRPEIWPLLADLPHPFISWPGTARFGALTVLSFAAAGAALAHLADDPKAPALCRGILLPALLLWPVAAAFELLKLPAIALSPAIFALAGGGILVAAIAFFLLLRPTGERARTAPAWLVTVLFAAWIAGGYVARENVILGPAAAPAAAFGRPVAHRPAAAPAQPEAPAKADGKAVFDRICSTCHRLDARLVGPPLSEVVPKYRGRPEDLQAFIRNPVKVNPEYPAMPKLGLSEAEIVAVAEWLLQEVGQ